MAGDERGIHQARVALRRMRSQARMLQPWMDPTWANRVIDDLAALAAPFGPVRDLDVLGDRLAAASQVLDEDGLAALDLRRTRQRAKAFRQARATLVASTAKETRDRASKAIAEPTVARGTAATADEVSAEAVGHAWRRLSKAAAKVGKGADDGELHRLRIKVKRLRYASLALARDDDDPRRAVAKRAGRVQSVLGEINDAAVATAWLRGAAAASGRVEAFAAGEVVAMARAAADQARATWRQPWEELVDEAARVVGDETSNP